MDLLEDILTVTGFVGLIYSVFQWCYYNKIRFFLWINKTFTWKKDVNFELTILTKTTPSNIEVISNFIRKRTNNESRIISKSRNKIVFSYDTLVFQINADEFDDDGYELEVFIKNSNSTYKSARRNLHKIGRILDDLNKEDLLIPDKYQFVSSFTKKNPFIGPSVSTIKVDNIKNFIMVLSSSVFNNEVVENDNNIQIGLNKINYSDTNYSEVKLIAEIILAL